MSDDPVAIAERINVTAADVQAQVEKFGRDALARIDQQKAEIDHLRKALRFIKELSGECLDNGDVRVGTGAEVAMRHIWRRADETL